MSSVALRLLLGFGAFVLIGWGAGELWLHVVGSADIETVRHVAEQRSPALTDLARVVTWAGSSVVLIPLAVIACVLLTRGGLRAEALAVALSLGGGIAIAQLVKLLVARPRPPVEHLQAVSSTSFPSGHSTQASAFWFSLVLISRAAGASQRTTRVLAVLASLLVLAVAASRVYLGVHYAGDVVAGVLLGTGWALYVSFCMRERGHA